MENLIEFDLLPSTNTFVKENFRGLADRAIVLAGVQTQGRGRKERTWKSDEGGLYFSIFLETKKENVLLTLTHAAAVALCKTLEGLGPEPKIKWPNDVFINGAKVAGILTEIILENNEIKGAALGIGVNITQENLDVGQKATSLKKEGVFLEKKEFLKLFSEQFFNIFDVLSEKGFPAIKQEYLRRFPFLNRETEIKEGQNCIGVVKGISDRGELIIETRSGLITVVTGDMEWKVT